MSVSNGQIANASTFNNAFMSRTADTSTTGKVDLLNAGSATITDAQLVINNILVDLANAETDIDNLENNRVIKAPSSTDNALARFDGTTGQQIQDSLVTVSDTGSMIIPEDLTVQGNLTVEGTLTSVNSTDLEVEDKNITVNKGGSDVTAEGAGLTVERTGTDGSLVYEDALVSKWKAGAVGAEVELATVSSAQILTNKDIDGGVASNNRRITLPKDTLANLTALTRKAGTVVYATDTQKFYYDNGTSLIDPAAGASAAIDQTVGSADANKLIKTGSDGFLDESFNVKEPSFASESAFTTFLGRASQTGDRYFNTTDKKFYVYDGTAFIVASGSGGGGVVNLITNGNADDAVASIFTPYADAAATRPVDGTGGSPTVTTSITTTAPLNGTKSFLLTKPASNVQGQGWSVLSFTVDPAFRAKVLTINVDYIVNSGTFVAGSNTTDGDVIWYIYDVTNAQLIEPSSIKMFSNSSTISDKYSATFQTSATGSTYRLIAHVASTSALAYELKVDNVTVSPSQYVYGTPITDWQSYIPTITHTSGAATNYTVNARWRRIGQNIQVTGRALFSNVSASFVNFIVSLPSGLSIDLVNTTTNILGRSVCNDATFASYPGNVLYNSTTNVLISAINASLTSAQSSSITQANPFTFNSTDSIDFDFSVPIVGWSSSVQMSDNADTRVVNLLANTAAAATGTVSVNAIYQNIEKDSHGAYNNSTGIYTVPVAGDYQITAALRFQAAATTVNNATNITVLRNGTLQKVLGVYRTQNAGSLTREIFGSTLLTGLVAGDQIRIQFNSDFSISVDTTTLPSNFNYLSINRITGPSAIAASESVNARGTNTAGTTIPSGVFTTVPTPIIDFNSHNALATTGVFTCPVAGKYQISGNCTFIGSVTGRRAAGIIKNGSIHTLGSLYASVAGGAGATVSGIVSCVAGDTISLGAFQDSGANTNLTTGAGENTFSINKIGN